jgi:hypothetical protein
MRGKAGRFAGRVFFSPANLAGLTGWWDASDPSTLFDATSGGSLVASDGTVARLQDKSGQGRHFTQSTSGNRPARKTSQQNGRDVLRFDGLDDRMTAVTFGTLFTSTASTCFIVAKASAASSNSTDAFENDAVFSEGGGSHGFFAVRQNSTVYSFGLSSSYAIASLSYSVGNWACLTTTHNGSTLTAVLNKLNSSSQSLSSRAFLGSATILGANYSVSRKFNGDVGEIIAYNVALSTADREKVEDYLMDKWGIS